MAGEFLDGQGINSGAEQVGERSSPQILARRIACSGLLLPGAEDVDGRFAAKLKDLDVPCLADRMKERVGTLPTKLEPVVERLAGFGAEVGCVVPQPLLLDQDGAVFRIEIVDLQPGEIFPSRAAAVEELEQRCVTRALGPRVGSLRSEESPGLFVRQDPVADWVRVPIGPESPFHEETASVEERGGQEERAEAKEISRALRTGDPGLRDSAATGSEFRSGLGAGFYGENRVEKWFVGI